LDYRTTFDFYEARIVGSFNIYVMPMFVKRYRRGSLQSLSMETIIMGDLGKKLWRAVVGSETHQPLTDLKIVVIDHDLPQNESGWINLKNDSLSMVLGILDKETPRGCELMWLQGGFTAFETYCKTSHQTLPNGDKVPNNRWIRLASLSEASTTASSNSHANLPSARPLSLADGLSQSDPSLTPKSSGNGNRLSAVVTQLRPFGRHSILRTPTIAPEEPTHLELPSPSPTREDYLDCAEIFSWLYLGADPCVIHNTPTTLKPSSPHSPLFVEIPSPSTLVPSYKPTSELLPSASVKAQSGSDPGSPMIDDSHSSSGSSDAPSSPRKGGRFSGFFTKIIPSIKTSRPPSSSGSETGHFVNLVATMQHLKRLNIRCVINLAFECTDLTAYLLTGEGVRGFKLDAYHKFGFWDKSDEDIEDSVNNAIKQIMEYHDRNPQSIIYVHCKAGVSRSATVIIAFLMKHQNWTVKQAYEYVKMRRPAISPNIGFMSVLHKLETKWQISSH
jgi:protein-tyrosine phosphatase